MAVARSPVLRAGTPAAPVARLNVMYMAGPTLASAVLLTGVLLAAGGGLVNTTTATSNTTTTTPTTTTTTTTTTKGRASEDTFLATERTYLASVRTALAMLGFGLVLSKFFVASVRGQKIGAIIAGSTVFASVLYLGYSTYRYFSVVALLEHGDFSVDKIGPAFIFAFCMSIFLMGGLVVREIRDSKAEKAVKSLQRAVNKGNDSDSDAASGSDSDSDTSRGPKRSGAEVELLAIGRHKRPSIYEDTGNDADAAGAAPEELMQAHRELMEQQRQMCAKMDRLISLMSLQHGGGINT